MNQRREAITGLLLGMMVGDAVGLPFENLSARRIRVMTTSAPLGHRLIFRRWGMVSDDTEHAAMTVAAWHASGGEPDGFARALAWRLRLWILCLPAGAGSATIRACVRLLLGVGPHRSGVNSAGNGPLMRSLVLGVLCDDPRQLQALVTTSTRITHTDERAVHAALALALAAQLAARTPTAADLPGSLESLATAHLPPGAVADCVAGVIASIRRGDRTPQFTAALGCEQRISGFVLHTLPVVLHAWLNHPGNCRDAVESVIRLGGDTDTTGALVGGLVGARVGPGGIPADWLAGIKDFPLSAPWLIALASLAGEPAEAGASRRPRGAWLRWLAYPLRNLLFLLVVIIHAGRRTLPPFG